MGRTSRNVDTIETPTGLIPKHEDLEKLFKEHLDQQYSRDDYVRQFTIRIPESLSKLDRIENIYKQDVPDTPQIVFETFAELRKRLKEARNKYGDYISPFDLEGK